MLKRGCCNLICHICGKYSSNANEIAIRTYNINGFDRKFAVCINPEHPDSQKILSDMVNRQDKANKETFQKTQLEADKILKQELDRQVLHEIAVKKAIEEKAYTESIRTFNRLFQSAKARAEIFKALKDAFESESKE